MDPYDFVPDLAPNAQSLMDMQQLFITEGLLKLAAPARPSAGATTDSACSKTRCPNRIS